MTVTFQVKSQIVGGARSASTVPIQMSPDLVIHGPDSQDFPPSWQTFHSLLDINVCNEHYQIPNFGRPDSSDHARGEQKIHVGRDFPVSKVGMNTPTDNVRGAPRSLCATENFFGSSHLQKYRRMGSIENLVIIYCNEGIVDGIERHWVYAVLRFFHQE